MLSRNFHESREIAVLSCRSFPEKQKVLMRSVHGNCEAQRRKIHDGRIGKMHDYAEKFLN